MITDSPSKPKITKFVPSPFSSTDKGDQKLKVQLARKEHDETVISIKTPIPGIVKRRRANFETAMAKI